MLKLIIQWIRRTSRGQDLAPLPYLIYRHFVMDLNLKTHKLRLFALKILKLCTTLKKDLP